MRVGDFLIKDDETEQQFCARIYGGGYGFGFYECKEHAKRVALHRDILKVEDLHLRSILLRLNSPT